MLRNYQRTVIPRLKTASSTNCALPDIDWLGVTDTDIEYGATVDTEVAYMRFDNPLTDVWDKPE